MSDGATNSRRKRPALVVTTTPAASEPMSATPAAPAVTAAKAEAKGKAWAIVIGIGVSIGRIGIVIRPRRRRPIGIAGRRRVIVVIGRALVLMHAGIIGVAISGLDAVGGMTRIVGTDGGARQQAGARARGRAQTGIARG